MLHYRKKLREKLKEYLSPIPVLGQNIFFDDPDVVQEDQIPCLYITMDNEQVEYTNVASGPRTQQRKLSISIMAFIKSNKNLNDKLDEACFNIENALAENRDKTKLDGLAMMNNLVSVDFEFSDDPELNIGSVRYLYEVTYRTVENDIS